MLKNYKEAVKNISKAVSIDPVMPYAYYFLLLCSFKSSKNDFNNAINLIKKNLKYIKNDRWMTALSKFLLGRIDAGELLEIVDDNKGYLCEAYFYIGCRYIFDNNEEKALEFFNKCIDTEVIQFFEYRFAEYEISQISNIY